MLGCTTFVFKMSIVCHISLSILRHRGNVNNVVSVFFFMSSLVYFAFLWKLTIFFFCLLLLQVSLVLHHLTLSPTSKINNLPTVDREGRGEGATRLRLELNQLWQVQWRDPKTGQQKVQLYYEDDPFCPYRYIIYQCLTVLPS